MEGQSQRHSVAVFGGTFDPPHNGHLAIARAARGRADVDEILFVPGARPPHKSGRDVAPFHHRLAMLEIALRNEPAFAVSDVEERLASAGPTYTCRMMNALREEHPEWAMRLLIGEDSLRQLHTWRDAGDLARRWPMLIYPRDDAGLEPLREELAEHWPPDVVERLLSGVIDGPKAPESSTELRGKLANDEDVDGLMDSAVLAYVTRHRLYLNP